MNQIVETGILPKLDDPQWFAPKLAPMSIFNNDYEMYNNIFSKGILDEEQDNDCTDIEYGIKCLLLAYYYMQNYDRYEKSYANTKILSLLTKSVEKGYTNTYLFFWIILYVC